MTYRECYEKGCLALQTAGIEEATLDARLLLEAVCGTNRNDLLVHGEQLVTPEAEEKYLGWIGQRAEHIPLQQLTGEQDFMGLTFAVNEHVLIPRQDTEILVEEVLKELHDGMRVLDMCTGSGCILLSLLHYSNACEGLVWICLQMRWKWQSKMRRRFWMRRTQIGFIFYRVTCLTRWRENSRSSCRIRLISPVRKWRS